MAPQPTLLPLSRTRRRLYMQLLILVFVVAVPFIFLYATGYRFAGFGDLVQTGGLYVGAERADAEIYVNDELVRETGILRRAFFLQNLEPGEYTIRVEKEGYHSWGKTLRVFPHVVTEAQAFTMPITPLVTLIPKTFAEETATTTRSVPNPVYEEIYATFATTTSTSTASTASFFSFFDGRGSSAFPPDADALEAATTTKLFKDMALYESDGRIVSQWIGDEEDIPFYFCVPEKPCAETIVLNTKDQQPTYFDFYPGTTDLVVVTLPDGVYVTEIDNRSGQNIQPLFLTEGADFRIVDGVVYIAVGERLYELEL